MKLDLGWAATVVAALVTVAAVSARAGGCVLSGGRGQGGRRVGGEEGGGSGHSVGERDDDGAGGDGGAGGGGAPVRQQYRERLAKVENTGDGSRGYGAVVRGRSAARGGVATISPGDPVGAGPCGARAALGYVKVGEQWMTIGEAAEARQAERWRR